MKDSLMSDTAAVRPFFRTLNENATSNDHIARFSRIVYFSFIPSCYARERSLFDLGPSLSQKNPLKKSGAKRDSVDERKRTFDLGAD